ncbi:MAG: hypothetical protein WAW61_11510 [Methylococcaceae bacterium]
MSAVVNKQGYTVHSWQSPTFTRKKGAKYSDLSWSEQAMSSEMLCKLKHDMSGIQSELIALFNANRKNLPKNCELMSGGVHGHFFNCPNALADKVESLIKSLHAEFMAQVYSGCA